MKYELPHTIVNPTGERIVFKEIVSEPDGDKVIIEGSARPGCGPPMHVHYKQDESFTVRKGKIGYQFLGGEKQYAADGETVFFKRGLPHKFWNAGQEDLLLDSWVKPVDNIVFFLSTLYTAQLKSGSSRPDPFDGAYLTMRYKNEYGMLEMPGFVRKVIIPITYQMGKLLGKYRKFKDAPTPL